MACSECARELTSRPNAICPNVIHWRAWSEDVEDRLAKAVSAIRLALGWNTADDPEPEQLDLSDIGFEMACSEGEEREKLRADCNHVLLTLNGVSQNEWKRARGL